MKLIPIAFEVNPVPNQYNTPTDKFSPCGRNSTLYFDIQYCPFNPTLESSDKHNDFKFRLIGENKAPTSVDGNKKPGSSWWKKPKRKPSLNNSVQQNYLSKAFERGGFGPNSSRKKIWTEIFELEDLREEEENKRIECLCSDISYIPDASLSVDIRRSLSSIQTERQWTPRILTQKRKSLHTVINGVMSAHQGNLHYYQGYHDFVGVLLLILEDETTAFAVAEQCSLTFLKEVCEKDLTATTKLLDMIHILIKKFDPHLSKFLSSCEVQPYYALSWVLTWFAHDVQELEKIARIYDVLLVSNPIFVVYLSAAVVLLSKKDMLVQEKDPAVIHAFLQTQPAAIDFETVIQNAQAMTRILPPATLQRRAGLKNIFAKAIGKK